MYINFCTRHHPDMGGLYTCQGLFQSALDSFFIDLELDKYPGKSLADFTISGSKDPLTALVRAKSPNFFEFIPNSVLNSTKGIIIHSGFLAHFTYGVELSNLLNVPLYFVPHGSSDPYIYSYGVIKKWIWLQFFGKLGTKLAKNIIYSSKYEKSKSVLPFSDSKGELCHWAVPQNFELGKQDSRESLRMKLKLKPTDKIVLFFSRIEKMKRPLETVKAFLALNLPNWKLLIVGPQQDVAISSKIAQYAESFNNIILHPPVFGSEKWMLLAGVDAYVLMSHRENFGFTVAEAALSQTPVFISKGVDIYPFFESKDVKNVFDIHCEADIRQCFNSMANASDNDLIDLGLFCESVVKEQFTYQQFTESLNKILS
jgi:glycosyltransferase involved in cell wall biosynthesis